MSKHTHLTFPACEQHLYDGVTCELGHLNRSQCEGFESHVKFVKGTDLTRHHFNEKEIEYIEFLPS